MPVLSATEEAIETLKSLLPDESFMVVHDTVYWGSGDKETTNQFNIIHFGTHDSYQGETMKEATDKFLAAFLHTREPVNELEAAEVAA